MTKTLLPAIAVSVLLCVVSVGCGTGASRTTTIKATPGPTPIASTSPTVEAVERCLRLAGFHVSKYSPETYPSARDTEVEKVVTYLIAESAGRPAYVYTARRSSPPVAVDVAVFQTETDARKDVAAVAEQKIKKAQGVLDPYQAHAAGNLGYIAWQGDPSTALASCGQG
jgi:hypothetical protein